MPLTALFLGADSQLRACPPLLGWQEALAWANGTSKGKRWDQGPLESFQLSETRKPPAWGPGVSWLLSPAAGILQARELNALGHHISSWRLQEATVAR